MEWLLSCWNELLREISVMSFEQKMLSLIVLGISGMLWRKM